MSAILIRPASVRERKGTPMVTMKEVAEAAGVSIATVSRVLNGKDRGRIKPEIAREIKRIAKDLGYRPNLVARNLKDPQQPHPRVHQR